MKWNEFICRLRYTSKPPFYQQLQKCHFMDMLELWQFHSFPNQRKLHYCHAFIKPHWCSKPLNLALFCLHKEPRMVEYICNAKEESFMGCCSLCVFLINSRFLVVLFCCSFQNEYFKSFSSYFILFSKCSFRII